MRLIKMSCVLVSSLFLWGCSGLEEVQVWHAAHSHKKRCKLRNETMMWVAPDGDRITLGLRSTEVGGEFILRRQNGFDPVIDNGFLQRFLPVDASHLSFSLIENGQKSDWSVLLKANVLSQAHGSLEISSRAEISWQALQSLVEGGNGTMTLHLRGERLSEEIGADLKDTLKEFYAKCRP